MSAFDTSSISYKPLSDRDPIGAFSCGEETVDRWLHEKARRQNDRYHCRVTVIYGSDESIPIGFYALSIKADRLIDNQNLIHYLFSPKYDHFPSLHLEWIAVRKDKRGKGLGTIFMGRVISVFRKLVDETGISALTLTAMDDRNETFYHDLGFARFGPRVLGRRMKLSAIRILETNKASAKS